MGEEDDGPAARAQRQPFPVAPTASAGVRRVAN
jgi:hypothetical protein